MKTTEETHVLLVVFMLSKRVSVGVMGKLKLPVLRFFFWFFFFPLSFYTQSFPFNKNQTPTQMQVKRDNLINKLPTKSLATNLKLACHRFSARAGSHLHGDWWHLAGAVSLSISPHRQTSNILGSIVRQVFGKSKTSAVDVSFLFQESIHQNQTKKSDLLVSGASETWEGMLILPDCVGESSVYWINFQNMYRNKYL